MTMTLDDLGVTPEERAALGIAPPETMTVAEAIAEAYPEQQTTTAVSVEIQQLYDAAKQDLNMLAAICVPHVFKYPYPRVFIAAWKWVLGEIHKERAFPKLALGLPRGFGKTLVIKLLILYAIIYTRKQYILVFGAREEMATNIIGDVANAMSGDNFRKIFGDWTLARTKDTQTVKVFHFRGRAITLQAAGAGTAIRGTNINDVRPDLIIFDDIQKREDADSKLESDKLKTWFQGTAMKLRSPFGCMYLFLANMYPTEHSMLRWLKRNPQWLKFITGAILLEGTSLWPELYPIEQLLDEYESDKAAGKKDIFMAELMNDENASVNEKLNIEALAPKLPERGLPHTGSYIIIDPARGEVGKDDVAIGYFEIHDDRPIALEIEAGPFSPGECIKKSLMMAMKHNCNLICVEAVAYQATLLYWFGVVTAQLGILGIFCEAIYPGQGSKNQRILNMFKEWAADEVAVSPDCWNQVMGEALAFNPDRRNNTDNILDLITYAPKVRAQFADFLAMQAIEQVQILGSHKQLTETELSPF